MTKEQCNCSVFRNMDPEEMIKKFHNFGELFIYLTNAKDITQAQLSSVYGLPKSTVSRILKSAEIDKQRDFEPKTVAAICVALKLSIEDANKVIEFAHPEYRYLHKMLKYKMSLIDANVMLYEKNLPLLT